jgi:signal transduction histidine kinase
MLRRIESFLGRRSRAQLIGLALLVIAVVGAVDFVSGPHMSFATFYLVPVGIGAWLGGRRVGYALAVVAALTALFGDLVFEEARHSLYPYWNTSIRTGLFVVIVELLSAMKQRFEQEREVAEREREMSRRLEELDALKDTFLRAVSHDVRNPLAAVVGSASILQQRAGDLSKEQQAALIDAIVRSGRQITRLIEELLDVEKIRGRAFEPDAVVALDLSSLVTGVVNEWAATRERAVTYGDIDRVVARVDPTLMQRILENLLDNAAKYSPPRGRIWVQVVRGAGGAILAVDDEGPGVPREMRSSIFELFERGQGTGTVPGMGLGLHLVARFSEMLGGRAWVEPRPEGGSSFRVFVPEEASLRTLDLESLADVAPRPGERDGAVS